LIKNYRVDIHIKLPITLDQRLDDFCLRYKKKHKSEAINEILEIGLFVIDKSNEIKNEPSKFDEVYKQLKEGDLVDQIQNLNERDFRIIYDILKTESAARYGKKNHFLS
jgi:hypothetical protein